MGHNWQLWRQTRLNVKKKNSRSSIFIQDNVGVKLRTCLCFSSHYATVMLHQLSSSFLASDCVFWTVLFPPKLCVYKSSSLPLHLCKNTNVQNSSKTLQMYTERFFCRNPLFMSALQNVSGSTTKTVSFLFSWSGWVASVGNTKIILAHGNENA